MSAPEQCSIDFAPADPRITAEEAPRLNRQCHDILAAFRAAPNRTMQNWELQNIAHRFGARLLELRKAGLSITITQRDHKSGIVWYRLENE